MDLKTTIDVGDNATKLIEKLSDQIGVTADKVFPWFVKQQILGGYSGICLAIFLFIFSLILFKRNWEESSFDEKCNIHSILVIVSAIIMCCSFIGIIEIPRNVTRILNPEYHALNSLIESMSKLR